MESLVHIMFSNALAATVMAVVAAAMGRIYRRPALTHGLWLVVLLKLVTPPLVPVSLPVTNVFSPMRASPVTSHVDVDLGSAVVLESLADVRADESTPRHFDDSFAGAQVGLARIEPEFAEVFDKGPIRDLLDTETSTASGLTSGWTWEFLVLIVVLAGAFGWWTLAAVRIIRFQRLLKGVQPSTAEWQFDAGELAMRMGLSWCPAVCLVPGRVPPMLWAVGGQPRLLVPSKLWKEMGDDERTSLLLHELAHLKRHDHWVRWLELVVAGLYWWHPVVWWARRALREAEEQCCDAWVVWAMPDRARTYAAALLAAVEFVSGARSVPTAASATSGNGHVSCLKRRLRMILSAKTPKGLSWAGRIAVLGIAALLLPLAPSWAQNDKLTLTEPDRLTGIGQSNRPTGFQRSKLVRQPIEDRVAEEFKKDPDVVALMQKLNETREQLEHAKRDLVFRPDSGRIAAQKQIDKLQEEYNDLWESKYFTLLARMTADEADSVKRRFKTGSEKYEQNMMAELVQTDLDLVEAQSMLDVKREANKAGHEEGQQSTIQELEQRVDALKKKKDYQADFFKEMQIAQKAPDDDKEDKARDAAERFQKQLQDLISKLGKELSPVTEEVRKALERAVGEVHQSLEKDGLSAEGFGKALEKSQEELRKAFEGGGAVDKGLREAIDRARKDMQDAFDRTKGDVEDQVESLRQQSRSLRDQAQENFERARGEAERRIGPDVEGQPNRDELESAQRDPRPATAVTKGNSPTRAVAATGVAPKPTARAKPAAGASASKPGNTARNPWPLRRRKGRPYPRRRPGRRDPMCDVLYR